MYTEIADAIPRVHLNGTGKQDLLDERMNLIRLLKAAREGVYALTVHHRDFYVKAPGSFEAARDIRVERVTILTQMIKDITEEWYAIEKQGKK